MTQLGPFMVLIGVAAVALAGLGAALAWRNQEARRIRRGLRHVLGGDLHAEIIAHGRGRGAGFNFTRNTMAVAWDAGAWCLIYRIDELLGVELAIDGQVAARAFRGEQRRPLDVLGGAEKQVSLRLVFNDPQHPDFLLVLWSAARRGRSAPDASEAVEEANRWLARTESVFRRPPPAAPRPVHAPASEPVAEPAAAEAPPPARPAPGPRQELPFDDDPPWRDDEDEEVSTEGG